MSKNQKNQKSPKRESKVDMTGFVPYVKPVDDVETNVDAEDVQTASPEPIEEAIQTSEDVIVEAEVIAEDIITELNDDVPPFKEEVQVVEPTNFEKARLAANAALQASLNVAKPITALNVSNTPKVKTGGAKDVKIIETPMFKLQERGYKQTTCNLEQNYLPKKDEVYISNSLQPQSVDPARCALIHLAHIMFSITKQEGFRQVKVPSNWAIVMDSNFKNTVLQHEDYPILKALGFRYNAQNRVTNYYADDADLEALQEFSQEYVQSTYDKIVEASVESHNLNSKNNQYTVTQYQRSSFLLELNNVMKQLSC